jgi:antitoxin ParD1/3/4
MARDGRGRVRSGVNCYQNCYYGAARPGGDLAGGSPPRAMAIFAKRVYRRTVTTMNISLPNALKAFVDEQVSGAGYGSSSEYIRELIRRDRDRLHLRGLLLEGASSAPTAPVTAAYFDALRGGVRAAGSSANA